MSDESIPPFDVIALRRRLAALVVIAIMTSVGSSAQSTVQDSRQSPTSIGTALIIGRVVDGTTGAPVEGVTVTIGGANAPRTGNIVLVDSQGRFMFRGLSAGTFTLLA